MAIDLFFTPLISPRTICSSNSSCLRIGSLSITKRAKERKQLSVPVPASVDIGGNLAFALNRASISCTELPRKELQELQNREIGVLRDSLGRTQD